MMMYNEPSNPRISIIFIFINTIEHYVCGTIGFCVTFIWLVVLAIVTKYWHLVFSCMLIDFIFNSGTSCYYYNWSVIR